MQKKRTAKETVFQILKERIMRQDLRAGDALPEAAIAHSLGVSRTPVREAILQLQKEGLVEVIPNRGAYVTFITLRELKNVMQLLQILEGAAVELAFEHLDINRLKALERELVALKERGPGVSHEETSKPGIQLHDLILQSCGNEKIFSTAGTIREQIRALSRTAIKKMPGRALESVDEHLKIIQAINVGDRSAAKSATIEHLGKMYEILTQIIV
ncbi:MAG: GntR family transcriptional regulator [Syntrophales bacterium]